MAGAVHQIGTAVPAFALRGIRREGAFIQAQPLPKPNAPAHQKGEWNISGFCNAFHRCQTGQIGLDVENVFHAHVGIGGIGEGRDQIFFVPAQALLHGVDELHISPIAKTRFHIWCEVGRVKNADGRFQGLATRWHIMGICCAMARNAAPHIEQQFAIFNIGGVNGKCFCLVGMWPRDRHK